jgi:hypothetical protein
MKRMKEQIPHRHCEFYFDDDGERVVVEFLVMRNDRWARDPRSVSGCWSTTATKKFTFAATIRLPKRRCSPPNATIFDKLMRQGMALN